LQTVLTAYLKDSDINGARQRLPQDQGSQAQVWGPRGYLTHTVTRTTQDEDAVADAAADTATPNTQPHGGAAAVTGRLEPWQAPCTASNPALSPGGKGKRVAVEGRMLGPKADADDQTCVLYLE
jgi:hypothetical protein